VVEDEQAAGLRFLRWNQRQTMLFV